MKSLIVSILLNLAVTTFSNNNCSHDIIKKELNCERKDLVNVPLYTNGLFSEKIKFDHNYISYLKNSSFSIFPEVIDLHLNNNNIGFIDIGAFIGLSHMRRLYLNNNLLKFIHSTLFEHCESLRSVYLHHNRFIRIPAILSSSISMIHLGNNRIISFKFPLEYLSCRSITKLDVSNNQANNVMESDLVNLMNCPIRSFRMKGNNLANIKTKFLYPIRMKLHFLDISNNVNLLYSGFKMILDSFDNVRHSVLSPVEIVATKIGLIKIDVDLFASMSKVSLTKLVLADNSIEFIEARFANLGDLILLDLSRNLLTELKAYQFSGLRGLERLLLKENSIQYFDKDALSDLSELKFLDLTGNNIKHLNTVAFVHLTSLRNLLLRDNGIVILSNCGSSRSRITNKFIDNNGLKMDSLCFTDNHCGSVIKDNATFGFNVDIDPTVCTLLTNGTNVERSVIKFVISNMTGGREEKNADDNNRMPTLSFSNLDQSRRLKKMDHGVPNIAYILVPVAVGVFLIILASMLIFMCRKRSDIANFCKRIYLIKTSDKISKTKTVNKCDCSNIYESISEFEV